MNSDDFGSVDVISSEFNSAPPLTVTTRANKSIKSGSKGKSAATMAANRINSFFSGLTHSKSSGDVHKLNSNFNNNNITISAANTSGATKLIHYLKPSSATVKSTVNTVDSNKSIPSSTNSSSKSASSSSSSSTGSSSYVTAASALLSAANYATINGTVSQSETNTRSLNAQNSVIANNTANKMVKSTSAFSIKQSACENINGFATLATTETPEAITGLKRKKPKFLNSYIAFILIIAC
jgi:hypothetical protein